MRLLDHPRVYLVGKTVLHMAGIEAFLEDHGMDWPTETLGCRHEGSGSEDVTGWPTESEQLVELMGRICYMSFGNKAGSKTNEAYIKNLVGLNREGVAHGSVVEHPVWNFIVTGAGRGFTHELVRHRVGVAYSQLSTRYCDFERTKEEGTWDPGFTLPPLSRIDDKIQRFMASSYELSRQAYAELVKMFEAKLIEMHVEAREAGGFILVEPSREERRAIRKAARGAARDVLPIGVEAIIGFSANARTLYNMTALRGNEAAEGQIREVWCQIVDIMMQEMPTLFGKAIFSKGPDGIRCVSLPREKL